MDVSFLPINPRLPGPLAWLQSIKYVRTLVTSVLYWSLLLLRVRTHDVIHVFSAAYWSFVLSPTPAILVAKLYRRKILLNYRSGEAADHLLRWRRSVPSLMRLADKIVVPSGYLVKVFEQFGIRADVVPNIVDLEHFAFRERLALRPVLLSARNLEPLYDIECLLRSFALVQAQIGDARLILAGDGSERARLEALRKALGLANVDFIGQVTPDEMPAVYDQADIFVNSSSIDNMPVSLIEASARGLPIVTTDAGGIGYMLKHGRTGLIVATGDHEGLARNVLALLHDARMALELARAARAECEKYTWGAVRCDWLALYRTLAER